MPTATQQQKGQRWGSDQGSQETQKPASVGTGVRSTLLARREQEERTLY